MKDIKYYKAENKRLQSSNEWLIAVVVAIIIVIAFFWF